MLTCPSCHAECPGDFKFCPQCGASLQRRRAHPEERRIVTTLFCDVVDFTAACEAADPEDVDRALRAYAALARRCVESFGGVVEKYIGDAVVAVFGVPQAHEDDPERAVHAALRIVNAAESLPSLAERPVRVRIGVNTGEALVRLDVDPSSGEGFLAGDAVNTAARLQAIAPPMGVVVGDATHSAVGGAFIAEALPMVCLKGKQAPVQPWLVRGAVASLGIDLTARFSTIMVGRRAELHLLDRLWREVVTSAQPRFALLIGEAGIGKSRLVFELARRLDQRPGVITWRQGRSPPYGDGIAFWALGEIVKSHAGVVDSDRPEVIQEKLVRVLPDGPDSAWLEARLRPLVGLESVPADEKENFAAWRQFLEGLARARPTVLVFEDLHWASASTLAFLEHLMDQTDRVPLLVLGTARPEFSEAHQGFMAGESRATRIDLASLTAHDTELLVKALVGTEMAPDLGAAILERSGGNPLYAEECVRFLEERPPPGEPKSHAASAPPAGAALPESLQALIAARLDALKLNHKETLANASVVGRRFWVGAVATIGGNTSVMVAEALRELTKRELVRPVRRSSVEGEPEFEFWHAVTQGVAYEQLPRAVRAAKHEVTARWIETTVGDDLGEIAEIVAHHYSTALDLARATGETLLADRVLGPTIRSLALAGDRALRLDVASAERYYSRALDLAPEECRDRPRLLVAWADTLTQSGRFEEASAVMEEGWAALRAAGDERAAALAIPQLVHLQQVHQVRAHLVDLDEALALLDADGPSAETIAVLNIMIHDRLMVRGRYPEAIATADRVLALCAQLRVPASTEALESRGLARCELGDRGGLEDMRLAVSLGKTQGRGHEVGQHFCNLADATLLHEGPAAALAIRNEGLDFAARRGDEAAICYLRTNRLFDLFQSGAWNTALSEARELGEVLERRGDRYDLQSARSVQAALLTSLGDSAAAEPLAVWAEEATRTAADDAVRSAALTSLAMVRVALHQPDEALEHLKECKDRSRHMTWAGWWAYHVPLAARCAVAAGDADLASRLVEELVPRRAYDAYAAITVAALVAESRGDVERGVESYGAAALGWETLGAPPEQAHALFGLARCLTTLDRAPEAAAPLLTAHDLFATLGARPALAGCEGLLAQIGCQPGRSDTARLR